MRKRIVAAVLALAVGSGLGTAYGTTADGGAAGGGGADGGGAPAVQAAAAPQADRGRCVNDSAGFEVCTSDGVDPDETDELDPTIYRRMWQLVDEAGPQDRIRLALYTWATPAQQKAYTKLAHLLADKYNKGKGNDVKVILGAGCPSSGGGGSCSPGGSSGGSSGGAGAQAEEDMGEPERILREGDVPLHVCQKACLPPEDDEEHRKIMHSKFLLIGGSSSGKVVQTSTNLMDNQLQKFQDLIVVPDAGLYEFYGKFFNRMWDRDWKNWDTDGPRTQHGSANGTIGYAFPRIADDPVLKFLDQISCSAEGSTVKVANSEFEQQAIADKLERLDANGCRVQVVAGNSDAPVAERVEFKHGNMHNKFIAVDAKFNGSQGKRQLVMTGSHNLREDALRGTSEANLRVERPFVFDAYTDYFDQHLWEKVESTR